LLIDDQIREGTLVEVAEGPLRISDHPHNFGIVSCMRQISGNMYAEVVTNTGKHRLIELNRLCVLNQLLEITVADADSDRGQHPSFTLEVDPQD
jgi:hypothetical protein